jgi:hypothetical protein
MIHCKGCIEAGRIGSQGGAYGAGAGQAYQQGAYGVGAGQVYQQGAGAAGATGTAAQAYGTGAAPYVYPYYGYPAWGQRHYQAKPKPKGVPNPSMFKIGAGGCIFTAVFSLIMGFVFLDMTIFYDGGDPSQSLILVSFFLMMALLPLTIGLFGFYKNYGTEWGLLGSIGLLVSGVLYFVLMVGSTVYKQYPWDNDPNIMYIYFANLTLGIGIFLMAVAVHHAKPFLKLERLQQGMVHWSTMGMVIAGILFMAFIGMFMIGWALFAVTLFLLANEFYHSPVPGPGGEEKVEGKDPWVEGPTQAPGPQAPSGPGPAPGPRPEVPSEPVPEPWEAPRPRPQKCRCPKCRTIFDEYSPKRPLKVKCPKCGQSLLLPKVKGK